MAEPNHVIGDRFVLVDKLGVGGFGEVWSAADRYGNDRKVALKLLHPHMLAEKNVRARFEREAKVLSRLDHPSIARALAFDVEAEVPYLAMEFVDGQPLDREIRLRIQHEQPFSLPEIERIMGELAAAVDYAHQDEQVVHRDLKPKNIMIVQRANSLFVKVLDFGIAKMMGEEQVGLTSQGQTLGSLLYMSAEQVATLPIDNRSDIFSLGVILFELLTLRHPWIRKEGTPAPCSALGKGGTRENNTVDLINRIAREDRPRVSELRAELPQAMNEVLERALTIEPKDRFDSAQALVDAFRKVSSGEARERPEQRPTERVMMTPEQAQASQAAYANSSVFNKTKPFAASPAVSKTPSKGFQTIGRVEAGVTDGLPNAGLRAVTAPSGDSGAVVSPFVTSRSGGLTGAKQVAKPKSKIWLGGIAVLLVATAALVLGVVLRPKPKVIEAKSEGGIVDVPAVPKKHPGRVVESPPPLKPKPPPADSEKAKANSVVGTSSGDGAKAEGETEAPPKEEVIASPPPPTAKLVEPPPPPVVRNPLSRELKRALALARRDPSFSNRKKLTQAIKKELNRIPKNAEARSTIEFLATVGVPSIEKLEQACRLLKKELSKKP